jgi:hypothetical protein
VLQSPELDSAEADVKEPYNTHQTHVVGGFTEDEFVAPVNLNKKEHSQAHLDNLHKKAKEQQVRQATWVLVCNILLFHQEKLEHKRKQQANGCTFQPTTSFQMKKGKIEEVKGASPKAKTDPSEKRYKKLFETV